MSTFNSYVVFDEDGELLAHDRETDSTPRSYFDGLGPDTQRRAHTMLVLQEEDCVVRHNVKQTVTTLGPREDLRA